MAGLGSNYQTLADLALDPAFTGTPEERVIIEMLAEVSPVVANGLALQCNNGMQHITTSRAGLPSVTWRRLYEGVTPNKSRLMQVTDSTGMLEAWSEIDAKIVDLSDDPATTRLHEATAFIEAMKQEVETTFFYGNTGTDPEKFMGLDPRFDSTTAENGNQIITAGGSGSDNTSIWFCVWSPTTMHLLYPKGAGVGLKREDKGKQTKESSNTLYDVFREKFTWDIGLSVRDWRYVSRVCNIDVSDLSGGSAADLLDKMIDAYYALQNRKMPMGRAQIYCNTTIKKYLHKQARETANVYLNLSQVEGQEVMRFIDMPIVETDAITNTEATIS